MNFVRRITLEGKTRKGKNRVREQGSKWEVIKTTDKVLFSSESGPWLFLQSLWFPNIVRWVHEKNDSDFLIQNV